MTILLRCCLNCNYGPLRACLPWRRIAPLSQPCRLPALPTWCATNSLCYTSSSRGAMNSIVSEAAHPRRRPSTNHTVRSVLRRGPSWW